MVFGPLQNQANVTLKDLNAREIAYLAPLLVAIVVMGVYPQPFLDRINPSVDRFVARFADSYDGTPYLHAGPVPAWITGAVGDSPASEPAAHLPATPTEHAE